MADPVQVLAANARRRFANVLGASKVYADEVTVEIPSEHLREVCLALRDEPEFAFDQLVDLCGVDYLEYGQADWETSELATTEGYSRGVERRHYEEAPRREPRFAVVYHLLSHGNNQRIRVRTYAADEPPRVDSVVDIWNSANWFEREAFDLFGILFDGHPDLRRILSDYGFVGHPFRKDFPLIGEVEMRYDPDKQRVVYQPVSIEPRVLVPRVIVHDNRYAERLRERPEEAANAAQAAPAKEDDNA